MSQNSSSSPPKRSKQLLSILSKLKRPSDGSTSSNPPTKTTKQGPVWRISEAQLQKIREQEEIVDKQNQDIVSQRQYVDVVLARIERKQDWVIETRALIEDAETRLRETERKIAQDKLSLDDREYNVGREQTWVNNQKKKYPYQFPEWRRMD